MHACVLPLNIYQTEHAFLQPSCKKKWLKITTPTTLCITCVIALLIHHSTEPTSMPVLLYSFHIKIIFQNLMTQLLRYYIRMGHTRKSDCALTPRSVAAFGHSIRRPMQVQCSPMSPLDVAIARWYFAVDDVSRSAGTTTSCLRAQVLDDLSPFTSAREADQSEAWTVRDAT